MSLPRPDLRMIAFAAVILAAGCSAAPAASMAPATEVDAPKYDFVALFTATNEVEYCTATAVSDYSHELGPGFVPSDLIRLSCQCLSDVQSQIAADFLPDEPALQNAVVQLGMNNGDLAAILVNSTRYPDGMDAYLDFMETGGQQKLGFNEEQLNDAIHSIGEFTNSIPEDVGSVYRQLPSCLATEAATIQRFPELGASYSREQFDEVIATREREYKAQKCATFWQERLRPRTCYR